MKGFHQLICVVGLLSSFSLAQNAGFSVRGHAALHGKDSFVLVFGKESIERGPEYDTRAMALRYQKTKHLRDFVWFATSDGDFVSVDPKVIAGLKETEEPQETVGGEQARVGGTDLSLAHRLSEEQNRLTWQRDELVWSLFDRLQTEGRLTRVGAGWKSRTK